MIAVLNNETKENSLTADSNGLFCKLNEFNLRKLPGLKIEELTVAVFDTVHEVLGYVSGVYCFGDKSMEMVVRNENYSPKVDEYKTITPMLHPENPSQKIFFIYVSKNNTDIGISLIKNIKETYPDSFVIAFTCTCNKKIKVEKFKSLDVKVDKVVFMADCGGQMPMRKTFIDFSDLWKEKFIGVKSGL